MTWIEGVIAGLVVIILLCMGGAWVKETTTHNACLRLGYPDAKLTYPSFTGYCIKRVNQTDSVVALSRLQSR